MLPIAVLPAAGILLRLGQDDLLGKIKTPVIGPFFYAIALICLLNGLVTPILELVPLGGIPPTVGFFGKYLVFLNAVGDGLVGLAVLGVLASLVGVFYYLRVVYYLYMKAEERQPEGLLLDVWGRTAAVVAALGTLALGIWPWKLVQWLLEATAR